MSMKNRYKILGIDPGTNVLGYGIIEVVDKKLFVPAVGIIKLKQHKDHQTKLKEIYLQLQDIIETYMPSQLAIEAPFFGKNVQSMLKLGRAQGVAIAAAITMGLDVNEYAPKKIKLSVTGNGNASKEQVALMLQSILKVKLNVKELDATDALAAAFTHYNQLNSPLASKSSHKSWASFVKANQHKVK